MLRPTIDRLSKNSEFPLQIGQSTHRTPAPLLVLTETTAHPVFKGASWVYFIRTDSGVRCALAGYWRSMLTTGPRWPKKAVKADVEHKIHEVSNLAWAAKNAECQSLEGSLIMCISCWEFSEKLLHINQENGKKVKMSPRKGHFSGSNIWWLPEST